MKTAKQYKDLTVREFTKAAGVYETGHAGIYEMCKDDYPPILAELKKDETHRRNVCARLVRATCKRWQVLTSHAQGRRAPSPKN